MSPARKNAKHSSKRRRTDTGLKRLPTQSKHWSRVQREPETIQLGRQLQALRTKRRWSLAEVAAKSGISMSTLSRIENNKLSPTMDVISKLLNGLQIAYHDLLIPSTPTVAPGFCVVTRKSSGRRIELPGFKYELLTTVDDPSAFYAVMLTVEGRNAGGVETLAGHSGEEFLHVISGTLAVHRQSHEVIRLRPGDTAYLDSTIPHTYVSESRNPAKVLIITNSRFPRGSGDGTIHVGRLRAFAESNG